MQVEDAVNNMRQNLSNSLDIVNDSIRTSTTSMTSKLSELVFIGWIVVALLVLNVVRHW
jgi:hypothetical protein